MDEVFRAHHVPLRDHSALPGRPAGMPAARRDCVVGRGAPSRLRQNVLGMAGRRTTAARMGRALRGRSRRASPAHRPSWGYGTERLAERRRDRLRSGRRHLCHEPGRLRPAPADERPGSRRTSADFPRHSRRLRPLHPPPCVRGAAPSLHRLPDRRRSAAADERPGGRLRTLFLPGRAPHRLRAWSAGSGRRGIQRQRGALLDPALDRGADPPHPHPPGRAAATLLRPRDRLPAAKRDPHSAPPLLDAPRRQRRRAAGQARGQLARWRRFP